MGTDISDSQTIECACGAGAVLVERVGPDHPYAKPSQTGTRARFGCASCRDQYRVDEDRSALEYADYWRLGELSLKKK